MHDEKYMANSVIERGYDLYDEWNNSKYTSRKIAKSVRSAVVDMYAKESYKTRIEALAYLFALDMRIKERYTNVFRSFFSYFAWRRETSLLSWMKGHFKVSSSNDVRDIIEVELQRIRENVYLDKADATDKNTHGGKSVGIEGEDYAVSKDEMKADTPSENTPSEHVDADEKGEEALDAVINEQSDDKTAEIKAEEAVNTENAEKQVDVIENVEKKGDDAAHEDKTEPQKEKNQNNKIENNGAVEESAPNTDKANKNKIYDYTPDVLPINEETEEVKDDEINFIDEIIMDNMIKGKEDILRHNPVDDVIQNNVENRAPEVDTRSLDKNSNNKDAYLYDKMLMNIKGGEGMTTNNTLTEKKPEENRIQIKVDESVNPEKESVKSTNDNLSEKMNAVHKSLMENALREEFAIAIEELDINAPVIIGDGNVPHINNRNVLGIK